MALNLLSHLVGSFAMPAAENPTVAMMAAAFRHHHLDWRYINCEVAPDRLGDAVRGALAMGWAGFNCSIPHKVAVIEHLDGLGESASLMGAAIQRYSKRYGSCPHEPRNVPFRVEACAVQEAEEGQTTPLASAEPMSADR